MFNIISHNGIKVTDPKGWRRQLAPHSCTLALETKDEGAWQAAVHGLAKS